MAIVLEDAPLLGPTSTPPSTASTSSTSSLDDDLQDLSLQRHPSRHSHHSHHRHRHYHLPRLQHARSAGVARAELISVHLSPVERFCIFSGIFLIGYAYGLESQVRSTYLPYATASFSMHSYLATINVLRSVVAVAVQPTAAKIADIFGRFEVVVVSTAFYVLGMMVEATAGSVVVFCLGTVLYQVGFTCIVLLAEILIADFSSMRARVFFSYVPALPFLVNTWISGSITAAVLQVADWRVGIGMWCIIYPVASLPLLVTLWSIDRRIAPNIEHGAKSLSSTIRLLRRRGSDLSEQLDAVGLLVLILAFGLILAPLTVAGGTVSRWRDPQIIIPLVLGLGLVPAFVLWERKGARTPLVPFHLLKDRGLWSALAVRSLLNLAWYVQANYLYTVLVVAFDFSIENATRILSFYSFFGVVSGVAIGWVVYRVRRLKLIIVMGTCLFMAALALSIKFPGGASSSSKAGIILSQVLLGIAGGFFAYPTQASIQASATRDHVAILTGLYLSFYNVGSALGTCLAGAIWTQTLYPLLESSLSFQPDPSLARKIYESPFDIVAEYPVGTEVRDAIIYSYQHVQRLLCITAVCVCVPMILFAMALRNPRLSDRQVQEDAETMEGSQGEGGEEGGGR